MMGSEDTLTRCGRPRHRDARPAEYRCLTRPGPVLDTSTFDLPPFSHIEVSEMDEDLSEALFWVCSSKRPRFDILTMAGTFCQLKMLNPIKFCYIKHTCIKHKHSKTMNMWIHLIPSLLFVRKLLEEKHIWIEFTLRTVLSD